MRPIVRKRILDRDGHRCVQCGATECLEIDHIQPLSKGGRHDEVNMQVLCRTCNAKKKDHYDFSRYFIFDESPDYMLVSPEYKELVPLLGLEQCGRITNWAFSEHERIWKERGVQVKFSTPKIPPTRRSKK